MALARAIQARKDAEAAVAGFQDAVNRVRDQHNRAEQRVKRAKATLETARSKVVDYSVAGTNPPVSVDDAEIELTLANKALAQFDQARELVDEQLKNASPVVAWRQRDVVEAIREVFDEEGIAGDLAAAVEQAQWEYLRVGRLLEFLYDQGALRGSNAYIGEWNAVEIARRNLQCAPGAWRNSGQVKPETGSWIAALQALQQDASTPLPEITR